MEDSGVSTDRKGSKHLFENLMDYVWKNQFDPFTQAMKKLSLEERKATCRLTNDDGCTLLLNASCSYETHFVKFLLEECGADTEQRGNWDGEHFEQVTPLWVASYESRLEVVKTLLQHGADINAVNLKVKVTPVLAACLLGNRDVVEFLVENGADINQPDNPGNTCLMFSVCHVELCRLLIQQGVSINAVNNHGDSALHHAIRKRCNDSIWLLIQHGADATICNNDGDDALRTAALVDCFPETEVLDLLIQKLKPPPQICADMYSLHAAAIMGKHDIMIQRALPFWIKSANLRTDTEGESEASVGANALYNFAVEAKDIDTLANISHDLDAMRMQALVVLERIIGPYHPTTVYVLSQCGVRKCEDGDYQHSVDLSKYALRNMRLDGADIFGDYVAMLNYNTLDVIHRILRNIWHENPPSVKFADVYDFLECVVEKISKIMSFLPYLPHTYQRLASIAISLVRLCCVKSCEEEKSSMHQLVHALLQSKPRTEDGPTLLHLAVKTYFSPKSVVVDCLLTAGAAVNAVDSAGNTPLHIAAFNRPTDESLTEDWEKMIQLLLHHGAHVDMANSKRQVAYDRLPNVDVFPYVTLKCLAARVVRANEIPYRGIVPKTLADFTDSH